MRRFIDIGRPVHEGVPPIAAESRASRTVVKRDYPEFEVPDNVAKHFEGMEVGEGCEVEAKLVKSGHNLPSPYSDRKKPIMRVQLQAISLEGEKEKENKNGSMTAKDIGY